VPERLIVVAAIAAAVLIIGLASRRLAGRRAAALLGQSLPPGLRDRLPAGSPSLLYFFGPHCASCRLQAQVVDELESRGVPALRINATVEGDVAGWFGILTVPSTVIVGADHSVRAMLPGFQPATALEAALRASA
jgi:thiol-disulfide isomerase/thioredoxin